MKNLIVLFLTLLAMLFLIGEPGHAFDCEGAKESMIPCAIYLTGSDPDPSSSCCSAVKDLKSSTPTKDDRHAACECLKEAASDLPNINERLANSLPKRCGVEIGFTIRKDINCDDVP